MVDELLRVFISSRQEELQAEREKARAVVEAHPLATPWLFELAPASSEPPDEVYLDKVRKCDIFVLILGSDLSNAVKNEYITALDRGIPILAFLKRVKQRFSRDFINASIKYDDFGNIKEFGAKLRAALDNEVIKGYRYAKFSRQFEYNEYVKRMLTPFLNMRKEGSLYSSHGQHGIIGFVLAVKAKIVSDESEYYKGEKERKAIITAFEKMVEEKLLIINRDPQDWHSYYQDSKVIVRVLGGYSREIIENFQLDQRAIKGTVCRREIDEKWLQLTHTGEKIAKVWRQLSP